MFYDLSVPWTAQDRELQRVIAFLDELGYNVVALTHTLSGKLPADLTCPIPATLPFPIPPGLRLLRRCNLILDNLSRNHRLSDLMKSYDLLAVRPTDGKTLEAACLNLDCDIISIDLTTRFPTHFKFRTVAAAIARGVRFELCYAPGVLATDSAARRNVISNATQLIRATRGRGIIISSEAKRAVGIRGPWDVINLAAVWGLGQERGVEAVGREAKWVVEAARLRRDTYRGVVDVVYGGEKPPAATQNADKKQGKRKAESGDASEAAQPGQPKLSKNEMKRQNKKNKPNQNDSTASTPGGTSTSVNTPSAVA